jgi:hypothetical protein
MKKNPINLGVYQGNYQPKSSVWTQYNSSQNSIYISNEKTETEFRYTFQSFSATLPIDLVAISECIKKSEKIVELPNDWDGEGSENYTQETFIATISFLINYAKQIYLESKICIDIPKIYPSANGSIDIDWETGTYGFLINIAKGGKKATYYADDKKLQMTEGMFNPNSFNINLLPKAISF